MKYLHAFRNVVIAIAIWSIIFLMIYAATENQYLFKIIMGFVSLLGIFAGILMFVHKMYE